MLKNLLKPFVGFVVRLVKLVRRLFSKDGLVITLLLLLIGAVSGFALQDLVQRQRYLELLQFEVRENIIATNIMIEDYNKQGGLIYTPFVHFNTDVYDAGLQSGYILTTDLDAQSQLFSIYTQYLPNENRLLSSYENIINDYMRIWQDCLISNASQSLVEKVCSDKKHVMDSTQKTYSAFAVQAYIAVQKELLKIKFNPTEDRLNSPLLRILMGSSSLKVQQ